MSLHPKVEQELLDRGYSRRSVARIALGASAALPFFHEFALAQQAERPRASRRRRGSRGHGSERDPDQRQRESDGSVEGGVRIDRGGCAAGVALRAGGRQPGAAEPD